MSTGHLQHPPAPGRVLLPRHGEGLPGVDVEEAEVQVSEPVLGWRGAQTDGPAEL